MPYSIYVIELSKKAFSENRKFREANPQYNGITECLYVGMTSKSPETRFKQHKTGTLSKKGHNLAASIVKKYGLYLRPSLSEGFRPKTRQEALEMEKTACFRTSAKKICCMV